jgi:hypothetical protein
MASNFLVGVGGLASGLAQGITTAKQIRRQRALDDAAAKQHEADNEFRTAVQGRLEHQNQRMLDMQERQLASTEAGRRADDLRADRTETNNDFRAPLTQILNSHPEVADTLGPVLSQGEDFYNVPRQTAPDQQTSPEGVVVADPSAFRTDLPTQETLLTQRDSAIAEAAKRISKQKAEAIRAQHASSGARQAGVQERYESSRQERLTKAATPIARMKTDLEKVTTAVQSGGKGFDYGDSVAYSQPELRTQMDPEAIANRRAVENIFNGFMREGAGLAQTDSEVLRQLKGRLLGPRVQREDFEAAWQDLLNEIDSWQSAAFAGFDEDEVDRWMKRYEAGPHRLVRGGDKNANRPKDGGKSVATPTLSTFEED